MRLERLQLRGFSSAFPGVVDLNLRELAPGVIALVGPNGAGKTTLLECMGPAPIFRQLPARNGEDPIVYALGRDSMIEIEYSIDGRGTFRSRLNMDGPKKNTDAVLQAILPDGTPASINDGKRSTYDLAIAERFPSVDLFINSSFAAQGRGDEFTRAKPSAKKDLFTEFLALQPMLAMAKAASQAAELAEDAVLRLTVRKETLERETDARLIEELDKVANELQTQGGQAELRKRELVDVIAALEARAAVCQDQVAAFTAAQQRVRSLETELAGRRAELAASRNAAVKAAVANRTEVDDIVARRDQALQDLRNRIHANTQLLEQGDGIRAAVAAIASCEGELVAARERERRAQDALDQINKDLVSADGAVHAFTVPSKDLARATSDAALLEHVPCGGAGAFAACQFLKNATDAQGRIPELEATIAGFSAAVERLDQVKALRVSSQERLTDIRHQIGRLTEDIKRHEAKAKYEKPLIEAETRLVELRTKETDTQAEAELQITLAQDRHQARNRELEDQDQRLQDAIDRLTAAHQSALLDLEATAAGNSQAVQLQAELVVARREWDGVTTTLASVDSGRTELTRRRQDHEEKRARLTDVLGRLSRVQQELVEWKDLAKALGKGGLPDLEIDAAGPTISALTNDLLLSCFGPRFTLELVTQTLKADGGLKDEFTARVMDNEAHGGWRDISQLSGGEKTVVQEALMAAIAMYVNERSSMPIRTLWRDETGNALDPENAIRYVTMLRRLRERGGFTHVYFISHNPAAAALADAQIRVGGGTAQIVLPPFHEAAA